MFETLLRPHEVHQVPKLVSIDSIVEQVKQHELKKEQRRLQQVEASERKRNSLKRKRDQTEEGEGGPDLDLGTGDPKRRRDVDAPHPSTAIDADIMVTKHALDPSPLPLNPKEARLAVLATSTPMSKPMPEVRGHTSYLTFATLLPALSGVSLEKGGSAGADVSWENMETTTAFDQLIASIPEDVSIPLSFCE
jgi:tRNA (adenine57-N1/adenine58-N1)-methyltransferase catalytic subunit